jgi:orotate phosphoribosyltransferase
MYFCIMSIEKNIGHSVAQHLLQIEAVKLSPEQPFTWASGLKSPIYCDNRKIMSFPAIRKEVAKAFAEMVSTFPTQPEIIAGVATGGIGIGALVAEELNLPFIYVRSEAKKHGLNNQVEGLCPEGAKVLVIEDLISTGKSSLLAVDALLERKAEVVGMIAIFTYQFPDAIARFETYAFPVKTLSNYSYLLEKALEMNYIQSAQHEALKVWKENPAAWSEQFLSSHGN